jgi:hypothetical protein
VFEELIHATQYRVGDISRWQDAFGMAGANALGEIQAATKLIKNADVWGIPAAETAQTTIRLRGEIQRFVEITGKDPLQFLGGK